MEYWICEFAIGKPKGLKIDERKFNDIKECNLSLMSMLDMENRYRIFTDSLREFELEFIKICLDHLFGDLRDESAMRSLFPKANQQCLNVLTSARMYIDQMKRSLKAMEGNIPDLYSDVKAEFSRHYDQEFYFRFMENLRNIIQHSELPISNIKLGLRRVENDTESKARYTFDPKINIQKLNMKKMQAKVRDDIIKNDIKFIDIKRSIRIYASCFHDSHYFYRDRTKNLFEEICAARDRLQHSLEEISGEVSEITLAAVARDNERAVEKVNLSPSFYKHVSLSRDYVAPQSNFQSTYISSEIVEG